MSTAALVALALVIAVSLRARRPVQSMLIARLRVLLPAWRFFDRPATAPVLAVRAGDSDEWVCVGAAVRGPLSWAFAPAGNLALAYHGVVEQLVAEVSELDPALAHDAPMIVALVSYELVTRIAREHAPAGAPWQWRIQVDDEDFLVSPELGAAGEAGA